MPYLSGQEPHLLAYLLASSETFASECSTHHGCSTDVDDVVQYVHVPSAEALPFEDGGEGATFPGGLSATNPPPTTMFAMASVTGRRRETSGCRLT